MNTLVMTSPRQPTHMEQPPVPDWPGELEQARARLVQAEKMSAAGNLLAGIVHELNNPLTTILGFSELLLREGKVADPGRLVKIHSEAERSVRIIQNVLRLARADDGHSQIIDINDANCRTLDLAQEQIRLTQLVFDSSLSEKPPTVLNH